MESNDTPNKESLIINDDHKYFLIKCVGGIYDVVWNDLTKEEMKIECDTILYKNTILLLNFFIDPSQSILKRINIDYINSPLLDVFSKTETIEKVFIWACENNNIHVVCWLSSIDNNFYTYSNCASFKIALTNKCFDVVNYIKTNDMANMMILPAYKYYWYKLMAFHDNVEALKWLEDNLGVQDYESAFTKSILTAKKKAYNHIKQYIPSINIDYNEILLGAVLSGNKEFLEFIYNDAIMANFDCENILSSKEIMYNAIKSNNLEIIIWLYPYSSLVNVDFFIKSCEMGNQKIADYFYNELFEIIHQDYENLTEALSMACKNGHNVVIHWLVNDLFVYEPKVFVDACYSNEDDVIKFIFEEYKNSIPMNILTRGISKILLNSNINLAKWFYNKRIMDEMMVDEIKKEMIISGKKQSYDWLNTLSF